MYVKALRITNKHQPTRLLVLLLLCLSGITRNVAAPSDTVKYSRDFEFREGIYLSFGNFRSNTPIPRSKIISDLDKNSSSYISDVVSRRSITYLDLSGAEQKIASDRIWGYCQNVTLYIYFNRDFNRIPVIGSLCHFVSEYISTTGYYDPSFYGMSNTVRELRQYVLDTKSGDVLDFNMSNMEVILKRDDALYNEFMALKKKKKRDLLFLYLRKYNEKFPLSFVQ